MKKLLIKNSVTQARANVILKPADYLCKVRDCFVKFGKFEATTYHPKNGKNRIEEEQVLFGQQLKVANPDIPSASLEKAKSQILGALALMSRASAFPPLTFAVANVVSVMVAEAIALVVLTLFKETNNIDDQVKKSEYLKGKALNYVVSLISAGNLNADVCLKVFLRMVRCYRESYYLLEHSTDDVRLLKNIKSTEIAQTVSRLRERAKYDTWCQERRIKVPRSLAQQMFEADLGATVVGQIAEFEIEEEPRGIENDVNGYFEPWMVVHSPYNLPLSSPLDNPGHEGIDIPVLLPVSSTTTTQATTPTKASTSKKPQMVSSRPKMMPAIRQPTRSGFFLILDHV
ncbi:hypothetical protein QAD02_006420 [Eretmocerus hayati]|uniref:Uncharacterized protein n=1 Tax=Eretmocerus hayati TaxID=131215 RepID=A0ACC2N1X5_9HYME|nr:hypothetical protein QAD02_006420 [Eretmocerus hayati]